MVTALSFLKKIVFFFFNFKSGRSPGEGNGNPLQYSCLENTMDRGAWQATVHGVARIGHDLATKPPPLTSIHAMSSKSCTYFL